MTECLTVYYADLSHCIPPLAGRSGSSDDGIRLPNLSAALLSQQRMTSSSCSSSIGIGAKEEVDDTLLHDYCTATDRSVDDELVIFYGATVTCHHRK